MKKRRKSLKEIFFTLKCTASQKKFFLEIVFKKFEANSTQQNLLKKFNRNHHLNWFNIHIFSIKKHISKCVRYLKFTLRNLLVSIDYKSKLDFVVSIH